LRLAAVVVLSRRASRGALLRPLPAGGVVRHLRPSQAYARTRPGWREFERRLARLPGFMLDRGAQPRARVAALRAVLRTASG
jgi:hypothetical protein